MEPVWSVHPAHQRTHVCSCAGTGQEYEIPRESFALQNIGTKQVSRLWHDGFRSDNHDVQRHKEAYHTAALVADIHTDTASTRYTGERFCNSGRRVHHLVRSWIDNNSGVREKFREEFLRQVVGRHEENPVNPCGNMQDGLAQTNRGRGYNFDCRGGCSRRPYKLLDTRLNRRNRNSHRHNLLR